MKLKQIQTRVTDSSNLPQDTQVKLALVATPLLRIHAQKPYSFKLVVFARICVHSLTLLPVEIVYKCAWSIYKSASWKRRIKKGTIHWLVTTLMDAENICLWQVPIEGQSSWIYCRTAVHQLQQRDTAAKIWYSRWLLVCAWRDTCVAVRAAF
jgi:hypothetical protein